MMTMMMIMIMISMMISMIVMIHNNIDMRYNRGIMCHKTKTHRMKVTFLDDGDDGGDDEKDDKKGSNAMATMSTCNEKDDCRSYSVQKVVEF